MQETLELNFTFEQILHSQIQTMASTWELQDWIVELSHCTHKIGAWIVYTREQLFQKWFILTWWRNKKKMLKQFYFIVQVPLTKNSFELAENVRSTVRSIQILQPKDMIDWVPILVDIVCSYTQVRVVSGWLPCVWSDAYLAINLSKFSAEHCSQIRFLIIWKTHI